MYICICNAVTDSDIRNAVGDGVRNLNQLKQTTGCGTTCGSCKDMAIEVLQQALIERHGAQTLQPIMQLA